MSSSERIAVSILLLSVGFVVPVWLIYTLTSGFQSTITIQSATTQGQFYLANPTTTVSAPVVISASVVTPDAVMRVLLLAIIVFIIGIVLLIPKKK
jgi:hypothetical protein